MTNTTIAPTDASGTPTPPATRLEHMLATIEAAEAAAKIGDALAIQEQAVRAEESRLLAEMTVGLSKHFDSLDLPLVPIRLEVERHGVGGWLRKREVSWTEKVPVDARVLCGWAEYSSTQEDSRRLVVAVGITREGRLAVMYAHGYRGWNRQHGDRGELVMAPAMADNVSAQSLRRRAEDHWYPTSAELYSATNPAVLGIDTHHIIDAARIAIARRMDQLQEQKATIDERRRRLSNN